MTDITDRHTLRRMSWSELFTAAQEAEFQRDYERARIVWSFALHVATTTINKNLAIAHIRRCDTLLHKSKTVPGNNTGGRSVCLRPQHPRRCLTFRTDAVAAYLWQYVVSSQVALFRRLFRGRSDVWGLRWESKTSGK